MSSTTLTNQLGQWRGREALFWEQRAWSYTWLLDRAEEIATTNPSWRGRRVALAFDHLPEYIATALALEQLGAECVFLPPADQGVVEHATSTLDISHVLDTPLPSDLAVAGSASGPANGGGVVLFTSGTSGPPKPALHTWTTLSGAVRRSDRLAGKRWLLAYGPERFAGLQVVLQALLTGGCLVAPQREPREVVEAILEQGVEFASATPTFWRLLLHSSSAHALSRCSLLQITLGGEPAQQGILDALSAAFPTARISHIYASTEMGACFSVHDGRAGFPLGYLEDLSLPCRLRIQEGELLIRSSRSMRGYVGEVPPTGEAEWFATGDLVRVEDERVLFCGRRSDTINVGGNKVLPLEIEEVIGRVSGVSAVRVHALSSSMVGQLVAAEVQAATLDQDLLRQKILQACRAALPKFKVPARLTFVSTLQTSSGGKLLRRSP